MPEKKIKTRLQHKQDVEANWNNAVNFIPLAGELIIYAPDESHTYPRFKVGDGIMVNGVITGTKVQDLPFINNSDIYVGSGEMPDDCNVQIDPDGAVLTLEELKGEPGKSAYQYAKENGFEGTEEEYAEKAYNVTIDKVNVSDIVDNLTTDDSKKPLSATQGAVLKNLIDLLTPEDIGSGIFKGEVRAHPNHQTQGSFVLRNSIILPEEDVGSSVLAIMQNGEIIWTYE